MDKNTSDLIYLCKCAVNEVAPDAALVEGMNIGKIYKISQEQSVVAMVAYALEAAGVNDERFKQAKEKAIRKNLLLDVERGKLFKFLDENKIWHMPLKGVLLKEIYPKIGMRQMGDNDILFDKEYAKIVNKYFKKLGYECEIFGLSAHDVYLKKPVYCYEMHNALVPYDYKREWVEYYSNVFDRLIKDEGQEYAYHFSDEDFYIFMVVHEYMHYVDGGTGIRSLIDKYVYLKEKGASLDYDYIEKQCAILDIVDFEKDSRELGIKIFGDDSDENSTTVSGSKATLKYKSPEEGLGKNELVMFNVYLTSATYGTVENRLVNTFEKQYNETGKRYKFKYIMSRLFPMDISHRGKHPFIYKSIVLIPFYWVYRLLISLFVRTKRIKRELKALKNS